MPTEQPPTIRLTDYAPPPYPVEHVNLTFRLDPTATRVTATLDIRPAPGAGDLVLDGEGLALERLEIDGAPLSENQYQIGDTGVTIPRGHLPDGPFTLRSEVVIDPAANTALEGLYMSRRNVGAGSAGDRESPQKENVMYCTQCEAEGFRKITYFPDRPDVMATYSVRIEGDLPVMLSNGNPTASGPGWAEWHDPWPKPSYLFALVAGDLVSFDDAFTTASGREVALKIYVRPGDEAKCAYAMDALKRSMRWDEQEYGREYDLDLFMIVAVDDFNMGAMENKGLNVFNSKYVLASPETATDRDFELIEGIIAHEYFHNWTGNRITCRDWFQLCLKEGLTVFRDQQFSADQRSAPVRRIDDVKSLRARQFREDAGPLAHPVRPEEYIEINNFYTATVYEKGAEVIGMLHRLVGANGYRRALDLYFARHDGQACTIEDWLKVFEDATGRDLSQFKRWYSQAGTPRVTVKEDYRDGRHTLTLSQRTPPTPGQPDKAPVVIPVVTGLLAEDGTEILPSTLLELTEAQQVFAFDITSDGARPADPEKPPPGATAAKPVTSLLRVFSAPVILEHAQDEATRIFLLAHDTDPFNRWEAGQALMLDALSAMTRDPSAAPDAQLLNALAALLADNTLDPAFKALALTPPSADEVFSHLRDAGPAPDPLAIRAALRRFDTALAEHLSVIVAAEYAAQAVEGPYTPDAAAAGCRALRGRMLGLLTRLDGGAAAQAQVASADNMTETMQALSLLVREDKAADALAAFHARWRADPLVLDKWFAVQAVQSPPEVAAERVEALTAHPDFDWKTPNRFRALLGSFAMANMAGFHRADGAGYRLFTDWLIRLDPINPQTAARLTGAYESWRRFDEHRQALMLHQLQRLADLPGLSTDSGEMVGRILEARG